jgi:phospholipid/cholesterol/gamma-HCH transport system ATP-binding protein
MKIEKLKFENLCFSFEGQDPLLKNTDFDFPENQVCWIQSEEGQGNSTLLQILAGLQMPQMGQYLINDSNIRDMTFEEFLPYRLKIGYSFDYGGLISNRTLKDNILLPLQYHKLTSPKEAMKRVDEFIERFDFEKSAKERPAHVPGRLRKITCLLRALIHYPDLLLMDDPSVGLGAETTENFLLLLNDLRKKGHLSHMMVVSYDEKFMSSFNPQIIHLDEGQLYSSVIDVTKNVVGL